MKLPKRKCWYESFGNATKFGSDLNTLYMACIRAYRISHRESFEISLKSYCRLSNH